MLANWVKETTATTGTGTINLGGAASGFVAFSAMFASGQQVLYQILDGTSREFGIGTLSSGSPWTLARTTVFETLVSGTLTRSGASAINLSGAAEVSIAATVIGGAAPQPRLSSGRLYSANYGTAGGASSAFITANKQYMLPFRLDRQAHVAGMGCYCITAAASSNSRLALSAWPQSGSSDTFLGQQLTVDLTTTGTKSASFSSPIILPPGWYGVHFWSDGVPTMERWDSNFGGYTPLDVSGSNRNAPGLMLTKASVTGGATTLDAPSTVTTEEFNSVAVPVVWLTEA